MLDRRKDVQKAESTSHNIALIKVGIGLLLALMSVIVLPGQLFLPIGLIVSGMVAAFIHKGNKYK